MFIVLILVPGTRQYLAINNAASNACYYTEDWVRILICYWVSHLIMESY